MAEEQSREITRRGFIKGAVAGTVAGLVIGGGGVALFKPDVEVKPWIPEKWDEEVDILVLGTGGGGLAASIEAAKAGRSVIVMEVMGSALESNTAMCGGVVMGAETSLQRKAGISDSIAEFEKYLKAVGAGFEDPAVTRMWAQKAGETVDWLADLGVEFPVENLYISGNERDYTHITPAVARGHITKAYSGRPIAETLYNTARAENVKFMFNTKGTSLFTHPNDEVLGLEAEQGRKSLYVKVRRATILATGGFSRNKEFFKNFMPKMMTGGSFGSLWQQGDGILMGQDIGAKLVNMWIPQAATIGIPTTPGMAPCMVITIWGNPCIMVAQDGKRHFREDLYYEYLYERISEQEGGFVWTIWDQAVTDLGGELIAVPAFSKDLSREIEQGWVKKASSIKELAGAIGVDPDVLGKTVKVYNEESKKGADVEFGKEVGLGPVDIAPFYAAKTIPAICDTAGGLKINDSAQVVSVFDKVIPRLYATGATTGGWRGKLYPGSGTAVSFTITFGRIAGQNAAKEEPWE